MAGKAFDDYIAPARAYPQIWRILAGLVLTVGLYIGLIAAAAAWIGVVMGAEDGAERFRILATGQSRLGVVVLLFSFTALGIGPFLAARWLHKRPIASLFGPRAGGWRAFQIAATVVFVAWTGFFILMYPFEIPETGVPPAIWAAWLPLALPGLLIQTGAEEVLFRGYLQQQLAARFRSPLVWMLCPSALFGLLHFDAQHGLGNAWLVVAVTGLFGLVAADLTARTGALWAGWGLHFANNAFAILVLATPGPLDGLALFRLPFSDGAQMQAYLALDLIALILLWALLRRLLRV
jgi:membrane protease YdiL (CAAX protease family)